jgi:hypothetical protein
MPLQLGDECLHIQVALRLLTGIEKPIEDQQCRLLACNLLAQELDDRGQAFVPQGREGAHIIDAVAQPLRVEERHGGEVLEQPLV